MLRSQSTTLIFLVLLISAVNVEAAEPDWVMIDSLTKEKLPCPAGTHLDENPHIRSYRCFPVGPFIEFNNEGRISTKGITTALGNKVTSTVWTKEGMSTAAIYYTPEGKITTRGETIWKPGNAPMQVGKWEYWWPSGAKRLVVEFEGRDIVVKRFERPRGGNREPKALSLTAWDEDGHQLPASLLPIECSDLASSGDCPWRTIAQKRKYHEVYFPGAEVSTVMPDVLGLQGAILELFRERGLRLAYSGRSDRLVLVLTSPRSSASGDLSSYYRVRITRSANCPDKWCEASLAAYRFDAPIHAGDIDWSKSKPVDDDITQRVVQLLDQEIVKAKNFEQSLRKSLGKLRR